jgi:hypothetical protein
MCPIFRAQKVGSARKERNSSIFRYDVNLKLAFTKLGKIAAY